MCGFLFFLLLCCFVDGSVNVCCIVMFKDKFGLCLMVSGEVVFDGVVVYFVGDLGVGFK